MNKIVIVLILLGLGLIALPVIPTKEEELTYTNATFLHPFVEVEEEKIEDKIEKSSLLDKIKEFLETDTTSDDKYLPWHSCGHFSRKLAKSANVEGLPIGSVILSNHPVFRGKWNNHIMNYVKIDGEIYVIEPQTDAIYPINQTMFNYYRLYPDGTQVPSNWRQNLAPTGIIT